MRKNTPLKKVLFWSLQLFALGLFAQAPSLINYQGSARLANGIPLGNKTLAVKFDIHQGSAGGTVVLTETQVLQTNLLGLFTTQIGKTSSLGSINWAANTMFLEVSIDTTGGSNFTSLGAQQMVSTPYAIHAQSVPSSYVGNTLTIGSSSFALTPTITATPNTSITVSGLGAVTTVGTNTFDINIPAPTFTGLGTSTVSGTYPNYTVSSSVPTFTNTGQNIITGAFPNFTVNTPTVAAVPDQTLTPTGLVTVSNPATNSFVIGVQSPTFTNAGQNIITGSYPNYVVNTPTIPAAITPSIVATTTAAAGASVTSSGSSFSINIPAPTFTNTGQNIISGTYPNFTVNTPTVGATPNTTIDASGFITVLNPVTNSFVVGVQTPTFTNSGQNIITGSYPNYVVNTPTIPVIPSVNAAGIATVSAGPNYTVGVQTPTFTNSGQNIITGSYPNYVVNTPTIPAAITPSIVATTTAAAGASVSSSGSSFSINIPAPTFTNTGQNIISGTYPNFTVNTPTIPVIPSVNAAGIATVSAGPNYTVGVQTPTFTNSGQNIITGSYPNYVVNTPTTVAPPTVAGAGIATVSGAPAYVVNVATPVFNNTGQNIITGTYPNFSVNTPTIPVIPSVNAAGIATVSAGPNYTVGVQTPTFTNSGQNIITGTYPNYVVNTPTVAGTSIALTSTAAAGPSISIVGTNSFNINIPPSNDWALLGNAGTNPTNNFIGTTDLQDFRIRTNNAVRIIAAASGYVGVGTTAPTEQFDVSGTEGHFLAHPYWAGPGATAVMASLDNTNSKSPQFRFSGGAGAFYDIGKNAAGNFVVENSFDNPVLTLNTLGALGLGNASNFGTAGEVLTSAGAGAPATWQALAAGWGQTGNAGTNPSTNFIGTTDAQTLSFKTNNTLVAEINTSGYMGIGSASGFATTRLSLYGSESATGLNAFSAAPGTAIRVHNNDLTNNNFSSLIFSSQASNAATFEVAKIAAQATDHTTGALAGDLVFLARNASNLNELMRVRSTGAVGIGTSAPNGHFHVNSQTTNHAMTRLTSSLATTGLVTYIDGASAAITNYENTPLYFGVNVASRMSISNTGNVNIMTGVGLASEKLNVDGNISLEDATAGNAPSRVIGFPTASPGNHGILTVQAKSNSYSGSINAGGELVLAGGDYNHAGPPPNGYGGGVTIKTGKNVYNGSGGPDIIFQAGGSTATHYERMRITGNSGYVGIGTNAPTATLHVVGTTRLVDGTEGVGKVLTSDASGNASWQTASGAGWGLTGNASTNPATNFIGTTDAQDVVFRSNNTEVFRAQSAGVIRMLSGADRTITMQQQTSNIDANALYIRGSDAGTGAQARLGGNLVLQGGDGYNQSNPIHFGGSVLIRPGKNIYGAASYNSGSVIFQNVNTSNAYVEAARIDPNGNVGIGAPSPTAKLHVAGTTRLVDGTQGAGKVLTSDASGNATWQTPTSRIRSISIDAGMMDGFGALPATKVVTNSYSRAYLNFPDGTTTMMSDMLPIPKDWNGTSNMTITVIYSSPSNTGNFSFIVGYYYMGLNMDILGASVSSSGIGTLPPSATPEGMMEYVLVTSGASATSRMLHVLFQRNNDGIDSSTSGMHVWGYRIDYYD